MKEKKIDWSLGAILLLALFLYSWNICNAGNANDFYTAAIKSMTQSWANFWYASFDPAGYITVDKPPVALWFMTISAKIFGVHGWSVVLPSILFGVASIWLIYQLVSPYFGKTSGRLAALALTLTPIVVANSRSNNMDPTLIFFLLLAVYFLEKSIEVHQSRWLMLSFALVGVAFNIKMLQAFMILPMMYLFYFIASPCNLTQKLKNLSLATVVLVIFTLFWPLTVDLTPASKRPYIGGSTNNSVLNLAFGYNGIERLLGQSTQKNNSTPQAKIVSDQQKIDPAFMIGKPGLFRIFQADLGPQISWLLPLALIGAIGVLSVKKQQQILLWLAWLIPVYGFFSLANFFHPYYLVMLAPPIAALFGIGLPALVQLFYNGLAWQRMLLPGALIVTFLLQIYYVSFYYRWNAAILAIIAVLLTTSKQKNLLALVTVCLVAPAWWSLTPTIAGLSDAYPSAGPQLLRNKDHGFEIDQTLLTFLQKNRISAKYLFATNDSSTAAPYIIKSGEAVMAMGGFNGTDPVIDLKEFQKMVRAGEVKYYYYTNQCSGHQEIINWIVKNGKKISNSNFKNGTLYDLTGIIFQK